MTSHMIFETYRTTRRGAIGRASPGWIRGNEVCSGHLAIAISSKKRYGVERELELREKLDSMGREKGQAGA
jgi:hypothetical protein